MEFINFVRAAAIGLAWAGTFFTIMGVILPIFPLPLLFDVYKYSRGFSAAQFKKNNPKGIKWYVRSAKVMGALAIAIWLFILGVYWYSLKDILGWYMDLKAQNFWILYIVAAALPSVWFLRKAFKAWYRTYYGDELPDELLPKTAADKPITQQLRENKY